MAPQRSAGVAAAFPRQLAAFVGWRSLGFRPFRQSVGTQVGILPSACRITATEDADDGHAILVIYG
jgi:hypothetical protein